MGVAENISDLRDLLSIVAEETGALKMDDADEDSVGWTTEGPLPMTFGNVRRAHTALAALEAALSTDAEPVAFTNAAQLKKLSDPSRWHEATICPVGDGAYDIPLYTEPVKTAPAVAVSREEMAERLFATDWPNDEWDRFKDGDHAKERYLRMADTALLAKGQDVAGWCQPSDVKERTFLVSFEDAENGSAVFHDESEARKFFEDASVDWNCYLFGALPASKHGDAE